MMSLGVWAELELDVACPMCGETGVVSPPEWQAYWAAEARWGHLNKRRKATVEKPLPPDGEPYPIPCSQCRGQKRVPSDQGLELLHFVETYRWHVAEPSNT